MLKAIQGSKLLMTIFIALTCMRIVSAASAEYEAIKARMALKRAAYAQTRARGMLHEPSYDLRPLERLDMLREQGLTVKKGTQIKLLIEENPSTGYEWIIDQDAANELFSIEAVFVPPADLMSLGAPGHKEFTLTVGDTTGQGAFRVA